MEVNSLFGRIPAEIPAEVCETIVNSGSFRIERIISQGHASPPGFWYDQEQHEWVVVLQGAAKLELAEGEASVTLQPGDHVLIPAHRRHRVAWTSHTEPTIWLAVFFPHSPAESPHIA